MQFFENIIGKYYSIEKNETEFSNEFTLNIYRTENNKIKFDLEMATTGDFGKFGINWIGLCIFRIDHFALIIEKELDWVIAKNDKEKTISEKENVETLPIELYPNEKNKELIVYHKKIDKQIFLKKIT